VKPKEDEDQEFLASTEWDDVLTNASETEIVELAALLGFTGLINQVQYHAAVMDKSSSANTGGWNAAAKCEPLKIVPPEPDNTTNVEECIKKAKANEKEFIRININNIKEVKAEVLKDLLNGLKENTTVQVLEMANVGMTDSVGRVLAELIEANSTLKTVNAESNRLTGPVITEIVRSTLKNQTLIELRLSNQRSQILGNRVEMEVADAIVQNNTLLRLNLQFDTHGPRVRVTEKLKQNIDALRKKRVSGNQDPKK
jgi:tropomodulin